MAKRLSNFSVIVVLGMAFAAGFACAEDAPYTGWGHSGALFILTTPDGANLAGTAAESGFPLLVRLHQDGFDFKQAKGGGEDLRFASATGAPLAYQIEEWDAAKGEASVWVRIPTIKGNERQEIKVYWGKADAASESNGKAVFNDANGYLSVWHMNETVKDEVGTLDSKDVGTTPVAGMIGTARHFPGKKGVFCGDKIPNYPSAGAAHTTEAWFRAEVPNTTIIGWGNEGTGRGAKVRMQLRSPAHIHIDSEFSDINDDTRLPMNEWIHVVHTYGNGPRRLFINGKIDAEATTSMNIKTPSRLWLGGWYNNYDFVGDLDEVRISKVARSADWVRLEYENQKPLQTLSGLIVQPGDAFKIEPESATVAEGKSATFSAQAGGAQKLYWILKRDGKETVVAVDRLAFTFDAGRVSADTTATLQIKAIYPNGVTTKDIAITIKEAIPDPEFTLQAPAAWDGRATIEVVPNISNFAALKAAGGGDVKIDWSVGPFAVIKEIELGSTTEIHETTRDGKSDRDRVIRTPGKLILKRAQNSGTLTVTATLSNGGKAVTQSATIAVTEPASDPYVARTPAKDEQPEDGQFYARDDKNEGTLFYNGTLTDGADSVFLKLYADEKLIGTETAKPGADKSYALAVKLKPGLIKYKVEFGTKTGEKETVVRTVSNLVCGDAYLIDGQSNALATDTGEKSPPETNEWIRSYGRPTGNAKNDAGNLWCNPVWKAQKGEKAELGWWGMELAKRLLESQKVPIFLLNAAAGGTRIDQHQRNPADPTDLTTLYGKMLWRLQRAKLTHGIRAILWHQGENDQGSDGPTGGFGWESYQPLFIDMSAGWKTDFPNVKRYYVFQIWPNSCSMGGRFGSGDMLREKQRTLATLYSNMSMMSTLGITPPGSCHYPLAGWSEFAKLIQPLIERDFYGKITTASITPPNLRHASFANGARDTVDLEFDQPVVWADSLAAQFYLDGEKGQVVSGSVNGNVLTLKLKTASVATKITYLKEIAWSQDTLLKNANGIAALTFCDVPIKAEK